jgi:hypothetical protein
VVVARHVLPNPWRDEAPAVGVLPRRGGLRPSFSDLLYGLSAHALIDWNHSKKSLANEASSQEESHG